MSHFESTAEKLTEAPASSPSETSRLVVSGRQRSQNTFSGFRKTVDERRPLDLNLSKSGIESVKRILTKNGNDPEKTAEYLGVPLHWIKTVIEKYNLG